MTILILTFLSIFNLGNLNYSSIEKITVVVLEDGKAYLANVDAEGNVIHKFMKLEEVVDEATNMALLTEKATAEYKEIMARERDQIRFVSYDFLADGIGAIAANHLKDLSNHYNNSYANQIVITLGKRQGNEDFLKEKETILTKALKEIGIPDEDIIVKYKWDRGQEPTEFVKINTGLRRLPAA